MAITSAVCIRLVKGQPLLVEHCTETPLSEPLRATLKLLLGSNPLDTFQRPRKQGYAVIIEEKAYLFDGDVRQHLMV